MKKLLTLVSVLLLLTVACKEEAPAPAVEATTAVEELKAAIEEVTPEVEEVTPAETVE